MSRDIFRDKFRECKVRISREFLGTEEGTPKNLCDKDVAELSGELSGAIYLKALVLFGSTLALFRKLFGAVRAIFWLWGSFFGPGRTSLRDYRRPILHFVGDQDNQRTLPY